MRGWMLGLSAIVTATAATASDCDRDRQTIETLRRGAKVIIGKTSATVGAPLRIEWSRPRTGERVAAYLIFAFDKPVRFRGPSLYGLTPGAEAAFQIARYREQSRAIIPLYGTGAPTAAAFEATFLATGPNTVRWDVVGHDGCGESAGEGRTVTIAVAPGGGPSLVVGDPIDQDKPSSRLASADGIRLLEVREGRYRLLDAATGSEIAERAGTEPRFSRTGRFIGVRE